MANDNFQFDDLSNLDSLRKESKNLNERIFDTVAEKGPGKLTIIAVVTDDKTPDIKTARSKLLQSLRIYASKPAHRVTFTLTAAEHKDDDKVIVYQTPTEQTAVK